MIIDCFTFFNELDILEGRLEYLYDTVDYFIIVETDSTFSGIRKQLNYLSNISRYRKYSDKIVYFPYHTDITQYDFSTKPISMDYNSSEWKIEFNQRNYIKEALKLFPDDAIVTICDLDEIPSINALERAKDIIGKSHEVCCLEQKLFFYNFNRQSADLWHLPIVAKNGFVKQRSPQELRFAAGNYARIVDGGWHLSYWGGAEKISTKIKSFSHQELNREEFTNVANIQQRVESGKHPFSQDELIETDISTIPNDVIEIFSKYQK